MRINAHSLLTTTRGLFLILLAITSLTGCSEEKNKIAENTYVIVTGKILSAPDNNAVVICRTSLAEESAASSACRNDGGKTIKLTFHRTNPDILMLAVSTDLSRLSANHPGWQVNQHSLVCSGTNIRREQCHLKLTYTPIKERPQGAIDVSYEYLINGQKRLKKNQVSIVYSPSSPLVFSEKNI